MNFVKHITENKVYLFKRLKDLEQMIIIITTTIPIFMCENSTNQNIGLIQYQK